MEGVQVSGLECEGVALISPLAASFDSKIEVLSAPGMADVVRYAKPYVVIVSNRNSRTIVAHTISSNVPSGFGFTFYSTIDGEPEPAPEHIENQMFMAPDAVGPTGLDFGDRSTRGILRGEERLVGIGFEIPMTRPRFDQLPPDWDDDRAWNWGVLTTREIVERIKGLAAGIEAIKIKLDAVVFDDGVLIGPDTEGRLQRTFEAKIQVRQALYREIVNRLNNGVVIDAAVPQSEPPDWQGPDDFIGMFRSEAISTVHTLRKKYGNDRIREVIQQAILKDPFLIHRE